MRRQKAFLAIAVLALAFFSGGCLVTSLNPLYTDKDIVYEESLVGSWRSDSDKETWMFEKEGKNAYTLFIFDKETSGKFEVKLIRLGGWLFIDMFPAEPENVNLYYYLHTIPTHSFIKVSIEDNTLKLAFMELEWFQERIKNGTDIGLQYVTRQDESDMVLLTAPTDQLQAFVMKHADNDSLFKFEELKRTGK
ncbi:hypothetical protein LLG96_00550 [bacterium]|nr:hypothetical protein [bacterium]